jgi:restriction system protein
VNFADVAERVLADASGGPLHYREITQRAIDAGYITPRSATPWTYMASAISSDTRRRAARGERPRFAVAGRGYYRLQTASAAEEAITAWNTTVKARLRSRLHELDPATFESLIGELLQRAGFEEIEVTRRERDGGIDVRAILVIGGLSRVTMAVQVKRWRRSVPIEVVRELRGALSVHEQGLIVTTSKFTRDATAEATATGRAPIELVNGDTLIDLLTEHQLGLVKREVALFDIDEELFSGEVVEDPAALMADRDTTISRQGIATQRRFRIYRVPAGAPRLETLGTMLTIVGGGMSVDDYLTAFQHAFPTITRRDMAERFMRVMVAFGLAVITDNRLMLTAEGSDYLHGSQVERHRILAKLFTERIYGAAELLAADVENPGDATQLQHTLAADGAAGLTATQTRYLVDWAGELGLLARKGRPLPT